MPDLAEQALKALSKRHKTLALAESCTGGLIAAQLTTIPGASEIFDRGFITYSNDSKTEMIGVPADLIAYHGAVSSQVAVSMAQGALDHSAANIALSVTGIAGPLGGSAEKPVGLVYIGLAEKGREPLVREYHYQGSRADIRQQAADAMFDWIMEIME